jgi:hypothetical protein
VAAASVVKLITVVITETPMQRASRVTSADEEGVRRSVDRSMVPMMPVTS